jgi:hypothetical protein
LEGARFVVLGEHTLGCIRPVQPDVIQVLHSSVLRGSPWGSYEPGTLPVPIDTARMRTATREDFDAYGVSTAAYDAALGEKG